MLQITPRTFAFLTAARKSAPVKLPKERRQRIIDAVAGILRRGEPTRFAFEGACRHGIRAALCEQGWGWFAADAVAAEVVARALNIVGARRPAWQEAQPEWCEQGVLRIVREYCLRCRRPIPEERIARSWAIPPKFCSSVCGRAAVDAARARRLGDELRARHAATEAARLKRVRASMPPKPCSYCGTPFQPMPAGKGRPETIFCSPRCRNKARSRFYDPKRHGIAHPKDRWSW